MKIVSLQLKNVSEPRKNLSSFFHQIKFIALKRVRLKKILLSYSATFFFTDIYCMVNFDKICLQLSTSRFQGNFDVIFKFLESRNIPRENFKTRGYFKQKLSEKNVVFGHPSIIISLSFFKYAINFQLVGVRG